MGRAALKYVLDSVILIDHFNGIAPATRFLSEHYRVCALSLITRAEVLTGFDPDTEKMVAGVLDRLTHLPIDKALADRAAQLRRSFRWKLPDAFQAAVAQHFGILLVTRNTRDFRPDEHDFVHFPYRI